MGNFNRLTRARSAPRPVRLGVLVLVLGLSACENDAPAKVERQRRELLTPPNYAALHAQREAENRLLDENGMPIPSEQVAAGLTIPRGFKLIRNFERQWYFESAGVSAEALSRYVEARVFTGKLDRTGIGGFQFGASLLRDDADALAIDVSITPIKDRPDACELYIRQSAPGVPGVQRPSEQEVQAQMQARREHAD